MKSFVYAILLTVAAVATLAADVNLRLMTWNIRYAIRTPSTGERPWSVRRAKVYSGVNFQSAGRPETLLCFQEALHEQVANLEEDLGPEWQRVGVGRDDGVDAGEFSPIFFRDGVWELEKNRTYWLSETPDVPSKGWEAPSPKCDIGDAALNRIATVTQLRHRQTNLSLVFMCTHFDNAGRKAREESAKLLSQIATEWQARPNTTRSVGAGGLPVFLGGDLNSTPDDRAYKNLVAPGSMHNTREAVARAKWYGSVNRTFTGFTDEKGGGQIDHIFVKDPAGLTFLSYGVGENRFDDGIYASDHRPVIVDIRTGGQK